MAFFTPPFYCSSAINLKMKHFSKRGTSAVKQRSGCPTTIFHFKWLFNFIEDHSKNSRVIIDDTIHNNITWLQIPRNRQAN